MTVAHQIPSGNLAAHQLMLLHGAPLNNPDQRERFKFNTRFRVVARAVGDYGTGEPVVETEEMVVVAILASGRATRATEATLARPRLPTRQTTRN